MAVRSRKNNQYQIKQIILSEEYNPSTWTDNEFKSFCDNEVCIGYQVRAKDIKFGMGATVLNLYLIRPQYFKDLHKILLLEDLKNAWMQYLEAIQEDPKTTMFRNPPIKEWLDTKDNWIKKLANNLSNKYNRNFNDVLSEVNHTIMKCYSKPHVYMGNLGYIEKAAENAVRMEHRYLSSRMHGDHPQALHLDQEFGSEDDIGIQTYHDLIGKIDPEYKEMDLECIKQDIIDDLGLDFSPREIDTIMNSPGYLALSLYRRLNKWRKTHRKEDYMK